MPETFTTDSTIRQVVQQLGQRGADALRRHGYDVGEGFTDVLSQYQSLEHAARQDRVRDLDGLLQELNSAGR